jgi:TolA-binding protein
VLAEPVSPNPDVNELWHMGLEHDVKETGSFMVPATDEQLLKQAEIGSMRQMQDTLHRMGGAMQTMMGQVAEVRESMIRIEAQDVKQQLIDIRAAQKATEGRIAELEADRQQRRGAISLVEWLNRNLPWLVAMALGAFAYFEAGHK